MRLRVFSTNLCLKLKWYQVLAQSPHKIVFSPSPFRGQSGKGVQPVALVSVATMVISNGK